MAHAVDLLIVLVALAGDQHDVGRRGLVQREVDRGAPVLLARNMWELNRTMEEWPRVKFYKTRERA